MTTALSPSFRSIDFSRHYTYDQLHDLVGETNQPIELIYGHLIVHDCPTCLHQRILLRLYRRLHAHVEANGLGEVLTAPLDVVLAPHLCLQPDILFLAAENRLRIQEVVHGPVDLAAEILSPGNRRHDQLFKRGCYEKFGVKEYWLVDPEGSSIEVLVLSTAGRYETTRCYDGDQLAQSRLLRGFTVQVSDLFRP